MSAGSVTFRRSSLIGTAIAIALYGNVDLAHGQQSTNQADGEGRGDVLEEIVVRGIRTSLEESLDTKRYSDAFVDALTAEDTGKFPDKNVAEALQRVPGVVITRDFGEGERVTLRGTSPTLTRTLLNGHSLATADWFILDQLNTTRSFNYLMLPSDIIGTIKVYKSPSANLPEGGIGGLIDVQTRKPLDLKPMTFSASLQAAHTELSDETDPYFSGLASWKNADQTLGVLFSAIYQERNIRRDGVEVLGYFPVDMGGQDILVPSLIGSALFEQERIRKGTNFSIQYKPSDYATFNLSGLYSKFEADNINANFLAWGSRAIGNGGTLTDVTLIDDTAVAGTIASLNNGTSDFAAVYDVIDRFAASESRNIDLDADFRNGDWTYHFRVGTTDAEGNTDDQVFTEFGAPGRFTYDLRGRAPQVEFLDIDPTNPADVSLIFSSLHEILNDDSEDYFYADAERTLNRGALTSIEFGIKSTNHDRELVFNATTYGGFHVPLNATPGTTFAQGLIPGDYLNGVGAPGSLSSYWRVDAATAERILFDNLASGPGRIPYPQQQFAVEEDTVGGYVMANFSGNGWRGNAGVRVVETEQTSRGNVNSPFGGTSNAFGNFDPLTVEHTYTDTLPSFNIAYDLGSDLLVRFAAARVMARPDYTDIVPRASLNPGTLTGSSGNPNLDPFRANQADISLEWYPKVGAGLSATIFYKDIKSFITNSTVTRNFNLEALVSPNAACTPVGPELFDCPFAINERTNGGGGTLQGIELAGTWPLPGGFGVQSNYTYTDADADSGDPIPGASDDQFNLTVYYENERVSTRLAYTYRSEFFITFDRATRLNQDDLYSLDGSFSYELNENISLSFDAVNLTNEKVEQFASDTFRPRAIYDNGRIYYAGLRFRFN